ncbi:MAG: PD-(D/E)XK nuclease family protein [Acidobacteria bacterium]|nr:PD-(D/E)XK nuclease family protein [Acidobacteriota bacterium]
MLAPLVRFASYREIAAAVAAHAAESAPRSGFAWPTTAIVPSRGTADAIAAELLLQLPRGVAGLQLPMPEELAKTIVNDAGDYPRVATDAERRLAMRVATRSVDDPMMESRGIGSMLERAYRDVRDSGLTLDDLRTRVARARGLRNAARTKAILRAWSEYEKLIAQIGAVDPSDILRRAAELIGNGAAKGRFVVAGFYDMTGVQLALVSALDRAGLLDAVYIPVGAGDAYRFAHPFVARFTATGRAAEPPAMLRVKQPRVSVVEMETRHTELEATCREIAALLANGVRAQDIAMVARSIDPYDARLVQRFAAANGFAVSFEDERALTAQRVGRGIASLLRLRERAFPRAEVLELVRDGFRSRMRIDVDLVDAKTREARIAGGTSEELRHLRGKTHTAVDDYLTLLTEIEQVTRRLDAQLRGSEWSDLLTQFLARFSLETEEDLQAAAKIDEVASLFARFPLRFDVGAVLDALEKAVVRAPRATHRPTIFFGDVMRFRGRSFAHVFAVRMQDDLFPQRRSEDPLFPDAERRILGLREIGNGREEETLLFQLLFDGASTSLRFSFAGTDGFGKPLRKSTLLRGMDVMNVGAGFSRSGPASAGPYIPSRKLQLLAKQGTKSVFDGYVRKIAPELIATVTPSRLEDFGECPQKFLLKWILGVRDLDDPERELQINHRDKGSVDHRILESLYRSLDESDIALATSELPRLPKAIAERLEEAVDREFDRLEQEAPPFNRTVRGIERRATKRNLRDFVASDLADLTANDLVPRWFEYRFGKPRRDGTPADHAAPFIINAAGVPIRVDGQIDRIDVGENTFRIVDYKSGKALRHKDLAKKIDRGVRLQLALYAMAVAEFFEADPAAIRGTIKPLVLEAKPATFAFDLAEKHGDLGETLAIFLSAILNGYFPAFPNEKDDDFNSCKYCPVSHSCRTKHDADEKQEVTRAGEARTLLMAEVATP